MAMKKTDRFRCRICGNRDFKPEISKNGFTYVACNACETSVIHPLPDEEDLRRYYETYENDGGTYLQIREQDKMPFFRDYDLTFSDLRFDLSRVKKALDIGCATGIFLEYLQSRDVRATGIDVSAPMIARARSKGLDCRVTDLFDLTETFDFITLWDVIEHFSDPKKVIGKVYDLTEPGGYLLIQTPCKGLISDTFGEDWRHYIPPQHLYLFSQNSLFTLLMDNGFLLVNWIRIGSGNDAGTIPAKQKKVFDTICKKLCMGDNIILLAKKGY